MMKIPEERTAQRIKAAERRTEAAQAQLVRLKVAHAKGLSPEHAARLRGDDEEELASDADALLAELGGLGAVAQGRRPADFDAGAARLRQPVTSPRS